MNIRKLIIEDVRCFSGRQEFRIRPVTFLVGENSTGKSTALGCFQILADFMEERYAWSLDPDFNADPYQMGAFADIVRKARPAKESFQIGLEFQDETTDDTITHLLTLGEKERGSEPVIREQRIVFPEGEISMIAREKQNGASKESVNFPHHLEVKEVVREGEKKKFVVSLLGPGSPAFRALSLGLAWLRGEKNFSPELEELRNFTENLPPYRPWAAGGVFSFAPIRSRPQRTYDPLKERMEPEGGDMPMFLSNTFISYKKAWESIRQRLVGFGKVSGLFSDISVRKLGGSRGDPFQLRIKVKGPSANLADVGYGVSQLLPILVRIFNTGVHATF